MRPEDEPQGIPVPFGGVRPPAPKINAEPKMRGQVSRDPRGWKTTLPNVPLGEQPAQPQTAPQQPPQQPLPSSLDEFVPQTLPTPNLLPKYQGFSETELSLWEPLWMMSRGYTLPDDEFSRQMALMGYREQFKKEADLIAFDAYRKNLELRAQHDQRIRQLFAPIGQDFNTVFSSEAIQQALREVIDAYKATNPKISWNKLSADAKRREILKFMQQGKLPTVKRFAEQWGRLKNNFQAYRTLLQPADQMVVGELDGILGGSFEDFIIKYLTLNDPEEEEMQRQLQALRQQHQLYRQVMQEFPDLYQRPQMGAGTTGASPNTSPTIIYAGGGGGGGGQSGRGTNNGAGQQTPATQSISRYRAFLGSYLSKIKQANLGTIILPKFAPGIGNKPLDVVFGVGEYADLEQIVAAMRRVVSMHPADLTNIISNYPSMAALSAAVEKQADNLRTLHNLPNDAQRAALNNFYKTTAVYLVAGLLLQAAEEGISLRELRSSGQWSEIMNAIGDTVLEMALRFSNKRKDDVFAEKERKKVSEAVGAGGRDIATEYTVQDRTNQRTPERVSAIRKAASSSLGGNPNRFFVDEGRAQGSLTLPRSGLSSFLGGNDRQQQVNRIVQQSKERFKQLQQQTEVLLSDRRNIAFPVGTFTTAQDAIDEIKRYANNYNNEAERLSDRLASQYPEKLHFAINEGRVITFGVVERTENNQKVYKVFIIFRPKERPQQQRPQPNRGNNRRRGT